MSDVRSAARAVPHAAALLFCFCFFFFWCLKAAHGMNVCMWAMTWQKMQGTLPWGSLSCVLTNVSPLLESLVERSQFESGRAGALCKGPILLCAVFSGRRRVLGIPWELLLENPTSSAWMFQGLNPHRTNETMGNVLACLQLLPSDLPDLVTLLVSQLCLILESRLSDNHTYSLLPLFH